MPGVIEPPKDSVMECALNAATIQFTVMPTSNPWDYARAIVRALRKAGHVE